MPVAERPLAASDGLEVLAATVHRATDRFEMTDDLSIAAQ